MNTYEWLCTQKAKNSTENGSLADSFFTNQDVLTSQSVLVRESIQNAIDAKSPGNPGPVKMSFKLGEVSSDTADKYFVALYPRVRAAGLGDICIPDSSEKCMYLAVEDFNTTGLQGDLSSEKPETPEGNSYWYFAWASGFSNKSSGTKGKNGVGKIVFPRSSKMKSQLVYSVRNENGGEAQGLVFGNALLRMHDFEGQRWQAECRWMTELNGEHVPFTDDETIDTFRSDWGLERDPGSLGTSIVVPYCDEDFSAKKLIQCIIQDYFVGLLDGSVVCSVVDFDGTETLLSAETLKSHLTELDEELLTRASKTKEELLSLCDLYSQKLASSTEVIQVALAADASSNSWDAVELSDEDLARVHEAFDIGKVVEFQVECLLPATVKRNDQRSRDYFSVLLGTFNNLNAQAVFAREGILIPAAADRTARLKDLISLVVISPGLLADALGQAEGPSHERWSADESKFKEKYVKSHGDDLIRFVRDAAVKASKLFQAKTNEIEDSLFSKWFPREDKETDAPVTTPRPGKNKKKRPASAGDVGLKYTKTDSGFKVELPADGTVAVGTKAVLKVGYSQSQGGSPLAKSGDDFILEHHLTSKSGVVIREWDLNHLHFTVDSEQFKLEFGSFDTYRDLTVGASHDS